MKLNAIADRLLKKLTRARLWKPTMAQREKLFREMMAKSITSDVTRRGA